MILLIFFATANEMLRSKERMTWIKPISRRRYALQFDLRYLSCREHRKYENINLHDAGTIGTNLEN